MSVRIRDARPKGIRRIAELTTPYAMHHILLHKGLIAYFEDIQKLVVAIDEETNALVNCGTLHVVWGDIAEIHTPAVTPEFLHEGIDSAVLESLLAHAQRLGLQWVFCLTFKIDFFARHGFYEISGTPISENAFLEMLRSHDNGVKEFLGLTSYKPNTLGNTRVLRSLESSPLSKATNVHDTNSIQVPARSSGA